MFVIFGCGKTYGKWHFDFKLSGNHCFLTLFSISYIGKFQFECHGQNTTETSTSKGNSSEIDFETLSLLGVSHELAEEVK